MESSTKDSESATGRKLTLKISQGENGTWYFAIYTGDGTIPGSLKAAAGGYKNLDTLFVQARGDLDRRIAIQNCSHEWNPYKDTDLDFCVNCGIVKGLSLGSEDL